MSKQKKDFDKYLIGPSARQSQGIGRLSQLADMSGEAFGVDERLVASAWIGDAATVRKLLSNPGQVPTAETLGASLVAAVAYGYNRPEPDGGPSTVSQLIAAGADLTVSDENGDTVLIVAARNGYLDVVNQLILAGADLGAINNTGQTASDAAAGPMRFRVQKLLRDARSR